MPPSASTSLAAVRTKANSWPTTDYRRPTTDYLCDDGALLMSWKPVRRPLGVVPRGRPATRVPKRRDVATPPGGDPFAHTRPPPVSRAPAPRPAGQPPHPRKPAFVRDVDGGALGDLFRLLPDLPRPPRLPARLRRPASPAPGRRTR
jgi:hypothetical protein